MKEFELKNIGLRQTRSNGSYAETRISFKGSSYIIYPILYTLVY